MGVACVDLGRLFFYRVRERKGGRVEESKGKVFWEKKELCLCD